MGTSVGTESNAGPHLVGTPRHFCGHALGGGGEAGDEEGTDKQTVTRIEMRAAIWRICCLFVCFVVFIRYEVRAAGYPVHE